MTEPQVTMREKLTSGLMVVTQWTSCHGNDETAKVHRVRCGVAIEASLRQVVASIVTEPQVTMLKPWL